MNARNGTTAEEQQSALDEAVRALTLPEGVAWGFALVFFVVGDMATTAIGLGLGAVELSPGEVCRLPDLNGGQLDLQLSALPI